MLPDSRFLDEQIPLIGASYADVVGLGVDIPTRYAECFAVLKDGSKVRLRRREQLLGRSGSGHRQRVYFACDDGRILCLRTNGRRRRQLRSVHCWQRVALCRAFASSDERVRRLGRHVVRLVAVDGSLLFLAPNAVTNDVSQNSLERIGELLRTPGVLAPRYPA